MSDFTGRYYSLRDRNLLNSINAELMGDIIQVTVNVYKISPEETATNIYGETDQNVGKFFFSPIEITAIIDRSDPDTEDEDFGPDRNQSVVFKFREKMLQQINFFPQVGDIIEFNGRFHECDNVVQEQLLGGQPTKSHSIICNTHYSRLSKLNIVDIQG